MVNAGFGSFNLSLICESIAAQFLTFVPHGEQTLEESDLFSSRWRERSARNTSDKSGNVVPFLCGAAKMFSVVIHLGLKFPNRVLKQQPHNLQLPDAPLREAGFSVLSGSLNRFLFKKDTSYILQEKHTLVRSKSPLNRTYETSRLPNSEDKTTEHNNTTNFPWKFRSIKFNMWVELSSNFWHLSDIIWTPAWNEFVVWKADSRFLA